VAVGVGRRRAMPQPQPQPSSSSPSSARSGAMSARRRYSAAGSSEGEIQEAHGLRIEEVQDPAVDAGPGRHTQGTQHPPNSTSGAATYLPSSTSANSLLVLNSSSTGGAQSTGGGLGQVATGNSLSRSQWINVFVRLSPQHSTKRTGEGWERTANVIECYFQVTFVLLMLFHRAANFRWYFPYMEIF
jgi:hypothetical protein